MGKEISLTRNIKKEVERELWAHAAGRCEFDGCNRILYRSPVTQEAVNISEKAHIYSFSKNGPRGWGIFKSKPSMLNSVDNLILVCHDCHRKIDQDKNGEKYSAALLIRWKKIHEERIELLAGISPCKKSHVVLYGAKIGEDRSPIQFNAAAQAMFPNNYPAEARPINLSMTSELEDRTEDYWRMEASNLKSCFDREIKKRVDEDVSKKFSIFALAPQPLLIQLGALLTDKTSVDVYQLHREPPSWSWQPNPENFQFRIIRPEKFDSEPVLVISLSAKISQVRVRAALNGPVNIWELTIDCCSNDFLKSQEQLVLFRQVARKVLSEIQSAHGNAGYSLKIFPAMPVACAVEFGRVRMPKADMPWVIFDQNNKMGGFIKAIEITGETK